MHVAYLSKANAKTFLDKKDEKGIKNAARVYSVYEDLGEPVLKGMTATGKTIEAKPMDVYIDDSSYSVRVYSNRSKD